MSDVLDWGALLSVTIAGANRTADLIGVGEVDRELDAAGIAVVRLVRGSGKPTVGQAVSISGICATAYTGTVSQVSYDPGQQCWVVQCTDGLQEQFEGLASGAAVCALLPAGAIWHKDLHGEFQDGWEAAQDALGTIPYSIYMQGGALQSVAWAGSGHTTTIAHTSGGIYDGSVQYREASSRELLSQLTATVEIRYPRLHHWTLAVGWHAPGWDFCTWLLNSYSLPTRQMVAESLAGNTWALLSSGAGLWSAGTDDGLGIFTEGLPETGIYCDGNIWSIIDGGDSVVWKNSFFDSPANAVHSASALLGRRWAQTLTETYTLTVGTPGGTLGAVLADERASHDSPDDGGSWDASAASVEPHGAGWSGARPHIYSDMLSTADRTLVLLGMLGILATRIRRSQRQTTVTVDVEPGTEPALGSRCKITAEDFEAEGQVSALHTTWDGDSQAAACAVTVTVSSGSTAGDALTQPTAPTMTPAAAGYTLNATLNLDTHLGRVEGCDEQDDAWTGWVGNYPVGTTTVPEGTPVYNEGFAVETPDVPDEARNDQAGSVTATYSIDPLAGAITVY